MDIEKHRDEYEDVMPKTRSSSEKKLRNDKDYYSNVNFKASRPLENDITKELNSPENRHGVYGGRDGFHPGYQINNDYLYNINRSYDAKARHVRRHPDKYGIKRESVFESIEFI